MEIHFTPLVVIRTNDKLNNEVLMRNLFLFAALPLVRKMSFHCLPWKMIWIATGEFTFWPEHFLCYKKVAWQICQLGYLVVCMYVFLTLGQFNLFNLGL